MGQLEDRQRWLAFAPAAVFLGLALICIAMGIRNPRAEYDQGFYHLPAIEQFARELPRPNLSNYDSATTPGYHLIVAGFSRLLGDDTRVLRGIGSLFTVVLLGLMGWVLSKRVGGVGAMAMTFPMVFNLYVFSSGAWLLPDNAGWLFVLGAMVYLARETFDTKAMLACGAMIFGVALFRQNHLWLCAPFLAAVAAGSFKGGRLKGMVLAVLALIPAMAVVGAFGMIWHGMTPPKFQEAHQRMNFAAGAMALSSVVLPGMGFLPLLWDRRGVIWGRKSWILAGLLIGLALGAFPRTSYSVEAGRFSGWWNLAKMTPAFAGRSPVIIMMAMAGGGMLGAFLAGAPEKKTGVVFSTAFGMFIVANMTGAYAYQRYFDPMILMVIPLLVSLGWEKRAGWKLAGPWGLSMAMAGITALFMNRM